MHVALKVVAAHELDCEEGIMMFEIRDCNDYEKARMLFTEYSKLKGAEQCFVSFENELANIDNIYPEGQILFGVVDEQVIGCIAVKAIDENRCELKRLFIKSEYRGNGYSKLMFESILDRAKELGYKVAEIHTIPEIMAVGYKMYLSYGFKQQREMVGKAALLTKIL